MFDAEVRDTVPKVKVSVRERCGQLGNSAHPPLDVDTS